MALQGYQGSCFVDIYDGELWKSERNGCLQNEYHLYGTLNVDLVRVFLHNTHRLGIIDAVILDLHRSERYKEEDVMGLRVIPGASEPKLYLNSHISNQLSFYAYVYCFQFIEEQRYKYRVSWNGFRRSSQ